MRLRGNKKQKKTGPPLSLHEDQRTNQLRTTKKEKADVGRECWEKRRGSVWVCGCTAKMTKTADFFSPCFSPTPNRIVPTFQAETGGFAKEAGKKTSLNGVFFFFFFVLYCWCCCVFMVSIIPTVNRQDPATGFITRHVTHLWWLLLQYPPHISTGHTLLSKKKTLDKNYIEKDASHSWENNQGTGIIKNSVKEQSI